MATRKPLVQIGGQLQELSAGDQLPSSAVDAYTRAQSDAALLGKFGAASTSGVLDWNDVSNTQPGFGQTLLQGNATNGPGGTTAYYHVLNLEYSTKIGTGNVTQVGYGYNANDLAMRWRNGGVWTGWVRFLHSDNFGSFAPTKTGAGASGTWPIAITGNAATAAALQTPRTINGVSFNGSGNIALPSYDPTFRRIVNPGGAGFEGSGSQSGAIAVALPVGWINSMVRFTVRVYNYAGGGSFDAHIGGYLYQGGSSWYNVFATISGGPANDLRLNVRFGYTAGGKCAVYIGETSTAWSYVKVSVTDVYVGHSGAGAVWESGWAVTLATAFENVTSTLLGKNVCTTYAVNTNIGDTLVKRDANGSFSAGVITAALAGNATSATTSTLVALQNVADLDAVSLSGVVRQETPSSGFNYTTTLNLNSGDGRQQLTIDRTAAGGMKFRGNASGSGTAGWSAWKTVLDSTNFGTYAPSLTGVGASGSWSINAATATSAATLTTARTINGASFNGSANISILEPTFAGGLSSYSASDLDALPGNGGFTVRYGTSAATGKPTGTDHAVLTQAYSSAWATQMAGDWRTNEWYVRTRNNTAWGSWATLLHSGNFSTYAAPIAHVGAGGAAHANVVASGAAGFMTGADKAKLDGIAAGATNYTHPAYHPASVITQDASNRFVTDTEKATWNAKGDVTLAGTQTLDNKTLTTPVTTQNIQVVGVSTTAVRSRTYVMTASITLSLPASPAVGDWVTFSNRSGTLTCVIARNGQSIMGLAEDMTVNIANLVGTLVFADATRGWVFA